MRSVRLGLVIVFIALTTAGWAATFHFTATADPRQYDAVFDLVLAAIQSKTGGLGVFHVSPGDIDPPQNLRDRIDARFGTSAIWYPGIGNHEEETPADMTWLRDEYNVGHGGRTPLKDFTNQDGPLGTVETTYSWDYGNTHFIMLNEYWNGGTAAGSDVATDGDIVPALRTWLAADLAANTKPVVFVFGHEPAYPLNRHVGDSLDQYPTNRDAFWDLLESDNNVKAYIVGHTHVYSKYQTPGGRVWQIDLGNAGNDTNADGKTFLDTTVTDSSVTFDIWRDGGTGTYTKTDSWSVPVTQTTPSLTIMERGSVTIDGDPADWNLGEYSGYARGGESGMGDIALVGYDGGSLYYAGYWTGGVLPTSAADHTAKVYSRHDSEYVYFLARCDDSDLRYSNPVDSNWANDCVEFYVDPAHDGGGSPISDSTSDAQLVIDANNQKNVYATTPAYKLQVLSGVTSAVIRDGTGWWLEVRIAKTAVDPDLPASGTFGMDFCFRDNDNNNDPAQTTIYTWSDSASGEGFPSKVPDRWGDGVQSLNVCFSDSFTYPNGNLNGNGGWTGPTGGEIAVVNWSVKINGGATAYYADHLVSCAGAGGVAGVWMKAKRGVGTYTMWGLYVDDPSGNNLAHWYGMGTTARGRIGGGSQVTSSRTLTGTDFWDDLYVKINFAADTSEFFFNGTSLGTLDHSEFGAGDSIGRLRFERINNASAAGNYVYLDDLIVGVPDVTAPTATIGSPSIPITKTGPVSYTVDFSEPVYGFNLSSDIQLNSTGGATAGSVVVTGSGSGPYTVRLSSISGNGTLGITVNSAAANDVAGNGNTVSAASATFIVVGADGRISDVKDDADSSPVVLGGKALYLSQTGFDYIEELDRPAGIRVEGALAGSVGDLVVLSGVMGTKPGGERYVVVDAMSTCGTGSVDPLGLNNRALLDAFVCGLYVKIWGKVKPGSITGNSYFLTDGSDDAGIEVITVGAPGVIENEFVTVLGAAGLDGVRVVYQ